MIDWLQSILDWYMHNVNYWSVLVCMTIERSFISLPAGLVKMPLNSFIFYTAAGSGIWNLILATVGYFLYSRKELLEKYFTEISIVMLIVGIGFFTYLIIRSTRKKNN